MLRALMFSFVIFAMAPAVSMATPQEVMKRDDVVLVCSEVFETRDAAMTELKRVISASQLVVPDVDENNQTRMREINEPFRVLQYAYFRSASDKVRACTLLIKD